MKKMNKRELKKSLKKSGYDVLQWTWGLPQTLAGAVLYIAHRKDAHFDYRNARATVWDKDAGISLGKFIFVPRKANVRSRSSGSRQNASAPSATSEHIGDAADSFLLDHEYGHTLQSLILGPFYLLLVGAPSMLWNRLPYFKRKRKKSGKSYYSAPFESSANILASKASRSSK